MMKESLGALKAALDNARAGEIIARSNRVDAENSFAIAKAESVGVRIGSIVSTGKKRYRVCHIGLSSYREKGLKLAGKLIRKNGSDSVDTHDIWQDWILDSTEEEQA